MQYLLCYLKILNIGVNMLYDKIFNYLVFDENFQNSTLATKHKIKGPKA